MAPNPVAPVPADDDAVSAVLRLLAQRLDPAVALLVSSDASGAVIEEASLPSAIGIVVRPPPGLLTNSPATVDASVGRLSISWTELCGWRPTFLSAHPVSRHALYLVVAGRSATPSTNEISEVASTIATLLERGEGTTREQGASLRIAALIDNLPLPIVFVDTRSIEVFLNDQARVLLALGDKKASEAEVASAFARMLVAADANRREELASDPLASKTFELEKDGRHFEVDSRWIDEPRLVGRLWMFRDITGQIEIARLKDEIVSTVSHELRTPLTSIIGALRLMKPDPNGSGADQLMSLIDMAGRNSARLSRLIEDLLDLDKLQSGKLKIVPDPVDIAELLRQAVEQNRLYASNLGASLKLTLPGQPVIAAVDPDRILQVLANLISNAAKFSPAGGTIAIGLVISPESLRISVHDEGPGIPPGFRDRLFTRFAQVAGENERVGTGLGLAISKGIVEQHGGTISLEDAVPQGSIFHVDLPRQV